MRDPTIVTLEAQLDALAARIATLEWRHEELVRGLAQAGEPRLETAPLVASTAAMKQKNERSTRVRDLEERQRREQLEREHQDTLRELTRRVGRLEGSKR